MSSLWLTFWIFIGVSTFASLVWVIIRLGIWEAIIELLEAIVDIFTGLGD